MIDLKLSKKEKKKHGGEVTIEASLPEYPYGTTLSFEDDQLKKLKLEKIEAGDMVSIAAVGKVIRLSVNENDKEKEHKSIEIQIQKIEIIPGDEKSVRKQIAKEVWEDKKY